MASAAVASVHRTKTWTDSGSYSFGNSTSLKRAGSLPNTYSYEAHGNGHFESTELKCNQCLCLLIECQCAVESVQVGPTYLPNPDDCELPTDYQTHVQVFMRVPEMVSVEKTFYEKTATTEERTIPVTKTKIVHDTVEYTRIVPVVKMVPTMRKEIEYVVKQEEIEVPTIELVTEYEKVCRIESRPRIVTEECEETITVPVVKEVQVTRLVEEWTGRYVDTEVEQFCTPGDLICEENFLRGFGHIQHKASRSSTSSVSGDSPSHTKKKRSSSSSSSGKD